MIGNRYAAELIRLLKAKDIPESFVLQGTGLVWDNLQSGKQTVHKRQMDQLIVNAIRLAREPDLGLQFGKRLNTNTHGILGYALMSAATMREVVNVWLKYYKLNFADLDLIYRVVGDTLLLAVDIKSERNDIRLFMVEAVFASMYTTAVFLLNEHLRDAEIWFDYPEPAHAAKYFDTFPIRISFAKEQCQWRTPVTLLDAKLASANTAAARIYRQQCDEMLRTMKQRQGTARSVQKLMLEHSGNFPRINDAAQQLHMSERTLRRKLAAENTSFQEVLNDVRYRIACEYLQSTT
ncbi:MAG: AraC family transcriptional regulator ligand-binding domain-containing protein, partial [Pseudomonadales bacterium]